MTITPTYGRHAGPAMREDEIDVEIERLVETGIPSGLPAGLGEVQGITVRGAHRAEGAPDRADEDATATFAPLGRPAALAPASAAHLPWRPILTGALALLVVLALAFVAVHGMASTWGVTSQIS
ncbi:hypothetical protein D9V37_05815 [Nocardioides mangrovicus]|uniref:Uncharacterized protein n=1 Tax=Nocardioides mangrovicus TaxID=2478913 RepID=A0A3L8P5A9_9ACTN|nr:hypothetical protein [Nocardioides mangrovicus]RLV50232.1 hypothetical protein D9V37_05815 [Nocardioides mangrovicus]